MKKKFEISERSWRNLRRRVLNQTVEISNLKQYIRSYDLPEIVRKVEELKKEMTDFWIKQRNAENGKELAPEYQETAAYVGEAARKIAKDLNLATEFIKGRFLIIDQQTGNNYRSRKDFDAEFAHEIEVMTQTKELKEVK